MECEAVVPLWSPKPCPLLPYGSVSSKAEKLWPTVTVPLLLWKFWRGDALPTDPAWDLPESLKGEDALWEELDGGGAISGDASLRSSESMRSCAFGGLEGI